MDDPEVEKWLLKTEADIPDVKRMRLDRALAKVDVHLWPPPTSAMNVDPEALFHYAVERRLRGEISASEEEYVLETIEDANLELERILMADDRAIRVPTIGREGGLEKLVETLLNSGFDITKRNFARWHNGSALHALARVRLALTHVETTGPMIIESPASHFLITKTGVYRDLNSNEVAARFVAEIEAEHDGCLGRTKLRLSS